MPYIKQSRREDFENENPWDTRSIGATPKNAGELNYVLTMVIKAYAFRDNGPDYQAINDIRGALQGASREFERRVAFPFEDAAIQRNGDVYV